ncbi:hypothetical protein BG004_007884 [Podila humilis]|nr:hypothetical protein BG004_007884 [Podila humilis]
MDTHTNASKTGNVSGVGSAASPDHSTSGHSSGAVSTFSYLKARLFGSVAEASTSLTSSARELLHSKKSVESSKSSGNDGNERSKARKPNSNGLNSDSGQDQQPSQHRQQFSEGGGEPTPSLMALASTAESTNNNRLFSRTLPTRRQQPPQLGKQPILASPAFAPNNVQIPPLPPQTRSSASREPDTSASDARSQALVSTSNSYKHLSTGSIVYQEGFLNKKVDLHSGESGHGWKVYKVSLKSSKLYFYKPSPMDEKPKFQGPRDHQRHDNQINNAHNPNSFQHRQLHQHSLSSGVISPRLSITNECGMVLAAFKFESSTRTLLFEGNAKALNQGGLTFAPPATKYLYGECFTEIDRQTMQFKRHIALLLFEDNVILCKRKWIRYASTKVKDAIKFSSSSSNNNGSNSSERTDGSGPGAPMGKRQQASSGNSSILVDSTGTGDNKLRSGNEKQKGYFTKWKHVATYPLAQVEALDMASPVPSSAQTFYPFAAPATAATGSLATIGRNPRHSDASSIYTLNSQPVYVQQTTSTLELVITSLIDGKEFTHRLLFLPPSQEVRHQWYTKFNRAKEMQQSKSGFRGRVSFDNLSQRDTLSPRSAHSNQSTISLQSPSSPKSTPDISNSFLLNSHKMDRARMFCETTAHPDLQLGSIDDTGTQALAGASVNGFLHEIVFGNIHPLDPQLIPVFIATYPLFTAVPQILKELRRCISLCSSTDKLSTALRPEQIARVGSFIQGVVRDYNLRTEDGQHLQDIKMFVSDILQQHLKFPETPSILCLIDSMTAAASINPSSQHSSKRSDATRRESGAPSINPGNPIVDLSNVLITGLTPALFLRLDPAYFAQQVLVYHQQQLHAIGGLDNLLCNPAFFMRRYPTSMAKHSLQSSLVFSMYSPHFLTVLITHHVLIATQSVQSSSRRPKLLAQWIATGKACQALDDQAGFMAIAIGICSPGVIRLQETWKHVPMDLRAEVITKWIPLLIKQDMVTDELQNLAVSTFGLKTTLNNITSPSFHGRRALVPCVSNIKQLIDQLDRSMPSFVQSNPVPLLNVEKLRHIYTILDTAKSSIQSQLQDHQDYKERYYSPGASLSANSHLQQYFGHLASISQTLHDQHHSNELSNDAFESSLACEPHFSGQYLDYHYKNRKMTGSFIPLMFPEAAAGYRLFPIQLLLSLEGTGNTNRKSSFDEANALLTTTTYSSDPRERIQQQRGQLLLQQGGPLAINNAVSQQPSPGSSDWTDSTQSNQETSHLEILGNDNSVGILKPRQRTYSFPPSRVAPRGSKNNGAGSQYLVNMINPHLDIAAREWLSDSVDERDGNTNAVLIAMQSVAGIGYSLISTEAGNLLLKVQKDSFDTFTKAISEEDDTGRTQELLKPTKQWTVNGKGSNRSSLSVINGARRVFVKAGTLDMLLQVIVLGLDAISGGKYVDDKDDLISMVSRPLTMDHAEYIAVFFSTYRSFCTSSRLLEQLVAMFTFAYDIKPTRKSNIPTGLDLFSDPQQHTSSPPPTTNRNSRQMSKDGSMFGWANVLTMQLNVLKAIEHWIRIYFGDFLDDMTLKSGLCNALLLMAAQEESQRVLLDDDTATEAQDLREKLSLVQKLIVERSMTPLETPSIMGTSAVTLETFFGKPPPVEPTMENLWDAESILSQLNTAALGHYLLIRSQEWFVLFEVLESQSADPLGWYLPKQPSSNAVPEDDVIITGIHNTLYSTRRNGAPGTHWNGERLMNSLPLCLQSLCKLHHTIRGWVITQIAQPAITFEARVSRIQKMLDVIVASRERMRMFGIPADPIVSAFSAPEEASTQQQQQQQQHKQRHLSGMLDAKSVPSFVEAAVVSALVSPESRAYVRAWQEVAVIRKGSVETLEEALGSTGTFANFGYQPTTATSAPPSRVSPVPSIGWLIERMLETCCYVRDMSYESPLLINFDKRQYVYDLVNVYIQHQSCLRGSMSDISTSPPSALSSWLGQSIGPGLSFSLKSIRDAAQREIQSQKSASNGQLSLAASIASGGSTHSGGSSSNSTHHQHAFTSASKVSKVSSSSSSNTSTKIFSRLVFLQQEKNRRDQKEFERLDKQIKDTQGRIQKAQQEQAKNLEKQIKLEQSRSRVKNQLLKSTLMRAMRPISLAITNSWSSATTTVSNATALGSAAISGKGNEPTGTSAAATAAAAAAGVGMSSKHVTQDGQCRSSVSNKPALVINLINSTCSVAYTYTKRDYVFKIVTEEGGQSLLQAQDYEDMLKWIRVMNEAAAEATAKRRTLLDIDETLQLNSDEAMVESGVVVGLEEVGIYRVPGAVSAINKLRLCFNSGIAAEELDLGSDEWKDINVVAGALKQWLRELPEAVTTSQIYDALVAASALEDYDERLMTMKDLIRTLPPTNYLLLKRIIEHLERVTDYEEVNHMYATNLAIVFGPTLLRPGGSSATSFAASMKNLGHQQSIVRNMILQYHWLFDVEDEETAADETEVAEGRDEMVTEDDILEELEVMDDDDDEGSEFPDIVGDSDEDAEEGEEEGEHEEDHDVSGSVRSNSSTGVFDLSAAVAAMPSGASQDQATKDRRRKTNIFG